MLTVEQVKNLDGKVRKALDLIDSLKGENSMLRAKLDEYKSRVEQLESVVDGFKLEQLEIEEGIRDVLTQLDQLEDQITDPSPSATATLEDSASEHEESVSVPNSFAGQSAHQQVDTTLTEIEEPQKGEEAAETPSVHIPELEIF